MYKAKIHIITYAATVLGFQISWERGVRFLEICLIIQSYFVNFQNAFGHGSGGPASNAAPALMYICIPKVMAEDM